MDETQDIGRNAYAPLYMLNDFYKDFYTYIYRNFHFNKNRKDIIKVIKVTDFVGMGRR